MADRIAKKLQDTKRGIVAVIDFPSADGTVTALGETLSTQLSTALTQRMTATRVVDRTQLNIRLRANGLSPSDLREREIAMWLAGETGANALVFGSVVPRGGNFVLSLELIRIGDSEQFLKTKIDIPGTDQVLGLAGKPSDWPSPPNLAVACLTAAHSSESAAVFKEAGVSLPKCIYCPQPSYTDAARSVKYQGSAKLNVVVDERGRSSSIRLLDSAGNGLDVQAIKAIRTCKFKPAIKEGKPVAVCVVIEVTFHLY